MSSSPSVKIQTLELLNCIVLWITVWDSKIKSKCNQTWRLAIYLLLFFTIFFTIVFTTILYMLHNLILLIEIQKYNPVHEVFFRGEVNYNSKVWQKQKKRKENPIKT